MAIRASRVSRVRLGLGLGLVIVFNFQCCIKMVSTTPRLQVHVLLSFGKIDSVTLANKAG